MSMVTKKFAREAPSGVEGKDSPVNRNNPLYGRSGLCAWRRNILEENLRASANKPLLSDLPVGRAGRRSSGRPSVENMEYSIQLTPSILLFRFLVVRLSRASISHLRHEPSLLRIANGYVCVSSRTVSLPL